MSAFEANLRNKSYHLLFVSFSPLFLSTFPDICALVVQVEDLLLLWARSVIMAPYFGLTGGIELLLKKVIQLLIAL